MTDTQAEPTEGQKLAWNPIYVTLGGSPVQIVVDNRAVVALEARWGSIVALGVELQKEFGGSLYTVITDVLTATARGIPPGIEVIDLVDLSLVSDYLGKILEAFKQAGLWSEPGGNGEGPKTGRSRGNSSTTRPSSRSGSPRRPSGT